ncbi:MAG: hypothetical protein AB1649_28385, partial [Chloroflexota bacterium]
ATPTPLPPTATLPDTFTPAPTMPTPTYTLTPTLVGFKTATSTFTPEPNTPTSAATSTPNLVIPSQVLTGFTLVTLSAKEFYIGGCEPASVQFTAQAAQPTEVGWVQLFVRLKGALTGTTSIWTSLPMTNMGAGTFTYTLLPEQIKYVTSYVEPWVQYQLVALDSGRDEIGRTQIFDEQLRLRNCPTTDATPTP